jgi:hypothetical protein
LDYALLKHRLFHCSHRHIKVSIFIMCHFIFSLFV